MRSSKEIHKLIPGKVGSTVILGFRSADDPTVYYEVECVREMTRLGEMTLDQIARENQPQPGSAEPLDQDDLYDIKVRAGPPPRSVAVQFRAFGGIDVTRVDGAAARWSPGQPWVLAAERRRSRGCLYRGQRHAGFQRRAVWFPGTVGQRTAAPTVMQAKWTALTLALSWHGVGSDILSVSLHSTERSWRRLTTSAWRAGRRDGF